MKIAGITLWALLAVLVDVSLARVAFGALVPSLRIDLGVDLATAGLISGANAVGYLMTAATAPIFGTRVGLRRTTVIAHLVAALGFACSAISQSASVLIVMRVLSGFGNGAGVVTALRISLDAVEFDRRVIISTLAWTGAGLGFVLAAGCVPWLHDPSMWRIAMWFDAALALLIAITAPHGAITTDGVHATAAPYRRQSSVYVLVAYFLFGTGLLAYSTFAAVEPAHVAPLLRYLIIGGTAVVGSVIVAWLQHPERAMGAMMLLGMLGAVCAAAMLPIGDAFIGIGLTAVPGLATAVLRGRAGTVAATHAIALSTIAVGAGQVVGPLVAGIGAQAFGIAWAFGFAGAAYGFGVVLIMIDEIIRLRHPLSSPA